MNRYSFKLSEPVGRSGRHSSGKTGGAEPAPSSPLPEVAVMRTACALALVLVTCLTAPPHATANSPPLAEPYLEQGRLAEGETALVAALKENPKDAQARFSLGTVQFLRAVERMEFPSTRHRMICARSLVDSLYILQLCVRLVTTVCHDA